MGENIRNMGAGESGERSASPNYTRVGSLLHCALGRTENFGWEQAA